MSGNEKVFLDESINAVRIVFDESETPDTIGANLDRCEALLESLEKRFILSDLSQQKGQLDKGCRTVLQERGQKIKFDKHAFVGANATARMVGKIIMAVMGQSHRTGFFKTEAEAIAWFNKD